MGKIQSRLFGKREYKLVLLGLGNAGKTSIVSKFKERTNSAPCTSPTMAFNVEVIPYKNVKFHVVDVGGMDKIRPLWSDYCLGVDGLIFVVDSADRARIYEARDELERVIRDKQTQGVPLLVFFNKHDLPNAMTSMDIQDKLDLAAVRDRNWRGQTSSAQTGQGLFEGLNWLIANIGH